MKVLKTPAEGSPPLAPGAGYFQIKIHGAQAASFGSFWEKAKGLVVTSEVTLRAPTFHGEPTPTRSIHHVRTLKHGTPEQLGLSTLLVGLTPATVERVTIAIDYLLDQANRLAPLAGLINAEAFVTAFSLAPPAAAAATAISKIAEKVIKNLLSENDRVPLLKFLGDFSLATGDLAESYYVILGSRFDRHPLPRPLDERRLSVRGRELFFDDEPVTKWSYVILDIDVVPARTRALGGGQPWNDKLEQAEVEANSLMRGLLPKDRERKQAWSVIAPLLKEADILFRRDPLYLPTEAAAIMQETFVALRAKVFPDRPGALGAPPGLTTDERELLGVSGEAALRSAVETYEAARSQSERKLRSLGLQE